MNPGSMVSPPANSSEVSSQSTLPSFRAMKPSRLAAMWIVTRESVVALEDIKGESTTAVRAPKPTAEQSHVAIVALRLQGRSAFCLLKSCLQPGWLGLRPLILLDHLIQLLSLLSGDKAKTGAIEN